MALRAGILMMVKAMANLKTTASVKPTSFAAVTVFTSFAVSILAHRHQPFMMDSASLMCVKTFSDAPIDPSIWLPIGGIVMSPGSAESTGLRTVVIHGAK
jgi:hypothetical protein